jgi:flagellar basal-body rod modification protein FlgD
MVATTQSTESSAALIASLNAANSSLAQTAANAAGSASDLQNSFLTMLTAQLQNQDPLNPMDNSQITSQMAQLSTVSGISQLNTTLQALSSSMTTASASSMIGQGVLVAGSTLSLSGSQAVGGVSLTQPADNVVVTITDSSGNVVNTLSLGAQQAGAVPFTWNGQTSTGTTAPDGSYTFSAQAVTGSTQTNATTLSYGTVSAITPGAQGPTLDVGSLGGFAMSAIQMIL